MRKGRCGVTFESVGGETSVVFESHLLAFHKGVAVAHRMRKGRVAVTSETAGDETSGVFECYLVAFHQGVAPILISRPIDIKFTCVCPQV